MAKEQMTDDQIYIATLEAKLDKVASWLERLAANTEKHMDIRFPSLADAYKSDAANYRATAKNIRSVFRGTKTK